MNLQQVEYAQSKPWFVETGYSVPSFGDDKYMVRVKREEPNEFNSSMTSVMFDVFSSFDEMIKWEEKYHG